MTAYDDLIVSDAPVAYWPLTTNTNALLGPNPTTIGWGGATPVQQLVTGPNGVVGATRFESSESDDLQVNSATLQLATSSAAIEVWVRHDPGITGTDEIIYQWNSRGIGLLFLATSGNLRFFYFSSTTQRNADYGPGSYNCFDGRWHHIVGQYSSTTTAGTLWIDGIRRVNNVLSSTLSFLTSVGSIGASSTPNRYYDGDMAGLAVYNRALTDAEIIEHYQAGVADLTDTGSDPVLAAKARPSIWAEERAGSFMPMVAPEDPETFLAPSVTVHAPSFWQDTGAEYPNTAVRLSDDLVAVVAGGNPDKLAIRVFDISNNQLNQLGYSEFAFNTLSGVTNNFNVPYSAVILDPATNELAVMNWSSIPTVRNYLSTFTYNAGTFTFTHVATTSFSDTNLTTGALYLGKGVTALDQDTVVMVTDHSEGFLSGRVLVGMLYQRSAGTWTQYGPFDLGPNEMTRGIQEISTAQLDSNAIIYASIARYQLGGTATAGSHVNMGIFTVDRVAHTITVQEHRSRRVVGPAGLSKTFLGRVRITSIDPNLYWVCAAGSQYDAVDFQSRAHAARWVVRRDGNDLQIIGGRVFDGGLSSDGSVSDAKRVTLPLRGRGVLEVVAREYEDNPNDALDLWGYGDTFVQWRDVDAEGKSRIVGSRELTEVTDYDYLDFFSPLELSDTKSIAFAYNDYNFYNNYGYLVYIVDSAP
jgi:hypothetical protein